MLCRKCGMYNKENTEVCMNCGRVLKTAEQYKNNRKIRIIIILLIIVVFSISGALFIFRDNIINLIKKSDKIDVGQIYYYETPKEHIASANDYMMYADNEILIVADEDFSYGDIKKLAGKYDAEIVGYIEKTSDYQLKLERVCTIDDLESIVSNLENEEEVYRADINYFFETSNNSVNYGKEWSGETWDENDHAGSNWGVEAIHCLSAWNLMDKNISKVNPVKVGLIDNGFDTAHEDLGFAETFYNQNYMSYYNSLPDGKEKHSVGHGTHVAGTMAARSDNKEGICGVYPYGKDNLYGVSYYGVKDYDENDTGIYSVMFLKISYAELILRNVKVINVSLGYNFYKKFEPNYPALWSFWNTNPFTDEKNNARILGDFLDRLINMGYDFVIVSSAGNDSNMLIGNLESKYASWNNMIDYSEYPEVYNRIIVVGSVGEEINNVNNSQKILYDGTLNINKNDSGYHISEFSNLGNRVDVLAPGENIFSSVPSNKYEKNGWNGTSMASPHVTGVAAMVWSVNNDLKGDQVKKIICDSSHELFSHGVGDEVLKSGYKLVDAENAVKFALNENIAENNTEPQNGGILCWVVNADNEDEKISGASITATNIETNESYNETTDINGHFEMILPEGKYNLTVKADGYEDYTYFNNPIEVKNNGVNYLDDWIKMKKKSNISPDDWKNAYANFLNNKVYENYNVTVSDVPKFALVYIDDNDIPEMLLAFGDAHVCGTMVITYADGNAVPLGHLGYDNTTVYYQYGQYGCLSYKERGNYFDSEYGGMGDHSDDIYSIENIQAVKKCYLLETSHDKDGNYSEQSTFYADNIEITMSEYIEKCNFYKENMKLILYDEMSEITSENISKIIYNDYISDFELIGKCGDNATWSFDKSTGTLTIRGTGKMYDYRTDFFDLRDSDPGWRFEVTSITDIQHLIVEDGITHIGNRAFYDLSLHSVSLPESLKSIGDEAFYVFSTNECQDMFKEIYIPSSVNYIGKYALGFYSTSYSDINNDMYYLDEVRYNLNIKGYRDSQAEKYANENGINFISFE